MPTEILRQIVKDVIGDGVEIVTCRRTRLWPGYKFSAAPEPAIAMVNKLFREVRALACPARSTTDHTQITLDEYYRSDLTVVRAPVRGLQYLGWWKEFAKWMTFLSEHREPYIERIRSITIRSNLCWDPKIFAHPPVTCVRSFDGPNGRIDLGPLRSCSINAIIDVHGDIQLRFVTVGLDGKMTYTPLFSEFPEAAMHLWSNKTGAAELKAADGGGTLKDMLLALILSQNYLTDDSVQWAWKAATCPCSLPRARERLSKFHIQV